MSANSKSLYLRDYLENALLHPLRVRRNFIQRMGDTMAPKQSLAKVLPAGWRKLLIMDKIPEVKFLEEVNQCKLARTEVWQSDTNIIPVARYRTQCATHNGSTSYSLNGHSRYSPSQFSRLSST